MTSSGLSLGKREFSVEGAWPYDQRGPLRWVLSHLLRYKGLLASFAAAAVLTNVMFSAIPRLTGLAFDAVLQGADAGRLLTIAGVILAIVLLRGAVDLVNTYAIETLGQRLERDARAELYLSLLGKSQTSPRHQHEPQCCALHSFPLRLPAPA